MATAEGSRAPGVLLGTKSQQGVLERSLSQRRLRFVALKLLPDAVRGSVIFGCTVLAPLRLNDR